MQINVIKIILAYSFVITIVFYKLYKKYLITNTSYQNCLKALSQTDPGLTEYLKKEKKI